MGNDCKTSSKSLCMKTHTEQLNSTNVFEKNDGCLPQTNDKDERRADFLSKHSTLEFFLLDCFKEIMEK